MRKKKEHSPIGGAYTFIGWFIISLGIIIGIALVILADLSDAAVGFYVFAGGFLSGLPFLAIGTALEKLSEIAHLQAESNMMFAAALQSIKQPASSPPQTPGTREI